MPAELPSTRDRLLAAMVDALQRRGLHGVGLNELLQVAVRSAAAKTFFDNGGSEPWTTTPEELALFQAAETLKWGKVIKAAGIEPE